MKLYSVFIPVSLGVLVTIVTSNQCPLPRTSNYTTEESVSYYGERSITKREVFNLLSVIELFLSFGTTVAEAVEFVENLKDKYKAIAVIEIDNYYKAALSHPKLWTDKGMSETYSEKVVSGYRGALAVNGKGDGRGVELLVKYELQVDDHVIEVYAYARVEQQVAWKKENKFGIGIVKIDSNSKEYANAEEMEFMEIKEFGSESHIITHCYRKLVCVSGTFSGAHQAEGSIKILPVKVEDFAKGEIKDCAADRQEELDYELKYGVDRTKVAEALVSPVSGGYTISLPNMFTFFVAIFALHVIM